MAQYGWLLDPKRCIECRACETACKQWNNVATGVNVRYRQVNVREAGQYPAVSTTALSLACNHCENAWCVKVCTVHAITRRADGIVLIDESKCFGCRMCEKFCPYQVPKFNSLTNKVEKCTMCADRIDQNLQPACATVCPTGALQWGDWSQLQTQGAGQVPSFTDPQYTKPHIRFITDGWSAR
ncbi:MAG: 4Fe-4S dicluster domain-containing protein [Acidobacteria bacterium]|nr:4Fe-4S dicluster domain-containing protein [Acidobacteriota bacterium]